MAENLLDILTKVDRPTFTIDGESYELRHPNELSMTEFHTLSKMGGALVTFGDQFSDNPEDSFNEIRKVIDELLDMVTPDLPKEIREKLNPFLVMNILEAFIGLSRIEPKPEDQPAPKKSSPDSSDSTAAIRKTG